MLIDGHRGTRRIATIACRPDLQTIRNPHGARRKFLVQCIARKRVGVLIAACPETPGLAAAARELPIVFGDRVPIAGRNFVRVRIADHTALVIELAAQLEFERVDLADQLLVHLLDQRRIPWKELGIQVTHLFDQRLQLLARLGAILHRGLHLIEKVQPLIDLGLGIGRSGSLSRHCGRAGSASGAGVIAKRAVFIVPATAARITRDAGTPALTTLLATLSRLASLALLSTLARLATLALLSALSRLATLALLTALALLSRLTVARQLLAGPVTLLSRLSAAAGLSLTRLSLSRLPAGTSPEPIELIPQTR